MNFLSIDLTQKDHFLSIIYEGKNLDLKFNNPSRQNSNNWDIKIDRILEEFKGFDFKKLDFNFYAAGPGSYTGARLAFTFLDTLKFIHSIPFIGFSNLLIMQRLYPSCIPVIQGTRKDYFFRYNDEDLYTTDKQYLSSLGDNFSTLENQRLFSQSEKISPGRVAKEMLELGARQNGFRAGNVFPNYIKPLEYKKIHE